MVRTTILMVTILIILFVLANICSSSATIVCVYEHQRLWSDYADVLARLSLRCSLM